MRRITIIIFVVLTITAFAAIAMPQQPQQSARMPQKKLIQLTADSQQRGGNLVHATGNVQVRITPIRPDEDRTVIHADEVIYHTDTGEIETRGDARITIEKQ